MTSGIYEIANTINGKRYIGSTVDIDKRWVRHRWSLENGTHHSPLLRRSWVKYGRSAFQFRVLIICLPKHLIDYEQRCIDSFRPEYNISPTAGSPLGVRGRVFSPETRTRISVAVRRYLANPEARRVISEKLRGVRKSAEARARMSAAARLRKHSDETNRKRSQSLREYWARKHAAVVLAFALLAACADMPTKQRDTVELPVGTPCLTRNQVPEKPQLLSTEQFKALRGDSFVTTLWNDRLKRIDYEEKLEARIIACVGELPIPAKLEATPSATTASPPSRWRWPWEKENK